MSPIEIWRTVAGWLSELDWREVAQGTLILLAAAVILRLLGISPI